MASAWPLWLRRLGIKETAAANVGVTKTGGGQPQITGRSDSKNCRMLTMMCGRSVDVE